MNAATGARVQPDSHLTLHYRLSGPAGVVVDTFDGPPATLPLGAGILAPAFERRLIGLAEGEAGRFELPAGEAYGQRNPALCQWVARRLLDESGDPEERYEAGDVVRFPTPDGQGSYAGTVLQTRDDGAVLFDFNHPLAGHPVTLEVRVLAIL